MICFISDSRKNAVALRKILLKKRIFAHHSGFPSLENAHGIKDYIKALPQKPTVAIIDASSNLDFAEKCCKEFKSIYGEVFCIAIVNIALSPFVRFKYIPSADKEIILYPEDHMANELRSALDSLGFPFIRSFSKLSLGNGRKDALLLGYDIAFTESEYNILAFLMTRTDKITNEETILHHCFAESYRMVETNVRAHISSINKKGFTISGRRIILTEREKGYYLNPYM